MGKALVIEFRSAGVALGIVDAADLVGAVDDALLGRLEEFESGAPLHNAPALSVAADTSSGRAASRTP